MTEQPNPAQGRPHTPPPAPPLDLAPSASPRTQDHARLTPAGLILIVERLRGRLDDMLHLIDEITQADPESHE